MHAKPGLRVALKWKIFRPDSVFAAVITLNSLQKPYTHMIKFSLKTILAIVAFSALLSAMVASQLWFGESRLRFADASDRLVGSVGDMLETEFIYAVPVPNRDLNIRYQCPFCNNVTKLPLLTGGSDFSSKDNSRFNTFFKTDPFERCDIYCSGCQRPVRIITKVKIWLGTWDDMEMRGELSFREVIESAL